LTRLYCKKEYVPELDIKNGTDVVLPAIAVMVPVLGVNAIIAVFP
jgi:hypothetical protein